ncbi:pilus assembly PilX family protein [Stutzerimonas frequens]|jgi:type IV pilus assembly protein PilX|uniref:pilus assembly PilX family protein n=1 Tax=Stutzerimonas frequens TaxID=2968969 RepID=UPI0007B7A9F2|nr:PilX N-terminal domain-containing pilus assembly protein [Stutzerimonas frequens]MAL92691.1 pilus assembly protein PilX [Pseudomonas sp.]MCD1639170.1 pilus assembly protein PilX [Stutzerimonas stutzeri]AWT11310.1 pilus assembly protein PilX [Stutzerimonas frequens]KZX50724.1 pilus assembly protein PilX [Stutzerimonas frequens]MUT69661.1 pilus assembly protein PilX [Stutzerimonas frequens]|tara:strand:+ start:3064 stop:3729 length:666 start_codon:yes stop_codon:yes gene_type:complete
MTGFRPTRERGATLLVALVMLLIMTVLALSSMRGVVLESRITGNRAENLRLKGAASAALREAEFRFYGPAYLRDKLEPSQSNCQKNNVLLANGANRPCLLNISDEADRLAFMLDPLAFLKNSSAQNKTGADTDAADATDFITWMPYRGRIAGNDNETSTDFGAYWNTHLISIGEDDATALNAEYGAVMEGRGTYFYQINGQADDRLAVQSTAANVYVGLNN